MPPPSAIIRIGYPWWLRLFLHRRTVAITLGRCIYIAAGQECDSLIRHELVHVRQMEELGLVRFIYRYVAEYLRHRCAGMSHEQAYRAISFEAEAFAAEREQTV